MTSLQMIKEHCLVDQSGRASCSGFHSTFLNRTITMAILHKHNPPTILIDSMNVGYPN